jgi:two-component system sensor histidine kinase GlrK
VFRLTITDIQGPVDSVSGRQRLSWLRLRLVELTRTSHGFLRHISHELKTPLASLREGVSLLEDGVVGTLEPRPAGNRAVILKHNTGLV